MQTFKLLGAGMFFRLATVFSLLCVALLACILVLNDGNFVLILDDSYIHLALAENLPGHLGINLGEITDSSTSILYPWLLAPFARYEVAGIWWPLALNFAAALGVLFLIERLAGQIGWMAQQAQSWLRLATLLFFALGINLASLVFIGMEHTLHMLCALALLSGLIDRMEGRGLPRWFWMAFFFAPLLRYEALALNGMIMLWLLLDKDWKLAMRAALVMGVPQVAHAYYLHSLGLPVLPTSALYHSLTIAREFHDHDSLRFFAGLVEEVVVNLQNLAGFMLLVFSLCLLVMVALRKGKERALAFVLAMATLAHLCLSNVAWFDRYHVYLYALDLAGLAYLAHWRQAPLALRTLIVSLAIVCSLRPMAIEAKIPLAAHQTYLNPVQVANFVRDYWQAPFFANDVGVMSWRNPQDVIDVIGLSSEKARLILLDSVLNGQDTRQFFARMTETYKADLAILNTDMASLTVPAQWVPVAMIRMTKPANILGYNYVFLATNRQAVPALAEKLRAWAHNLPKGLEIGYNDAVVH